MFATIYLPNFCLQAATLHQPELCEKPVALIEEHERKLVVIQLNEAAENAGIRKGITELGVGAIIAGGHQSSCTHAGKIDTGNFLHYAFTLSPFVEDTAPVFAQFSLRTTAIGVSRPSRFRAISRVRVSRSSCGCSDVR